MKLCNPCGKEIKEESTFCAYCGSRAYGEVMAREGNTKRNLLL